MPFVKLDTGILDSTLWIEPSVRDVFITSLLMAKPWELTEEAPQIAVETLDYTGFVVPPGWYGLIEAAGQGIVRRSMCDQQPGIAALVKLGEPDPESRTPRFDGRRLVRISGGYIVLNYMLYRDKDSTAAVRQQRYRNRLKERDTSRRDSDTVARETLLKQKQKQKQKTEAEESKDTRYARRVFDAFWIAYPRKISKSKASKSWDKLTPDEQADAVAAIPRHIATDQWQKDEGRFIPHPATWLNQRRWEDELPEPDTDEAQDARVWARIEANEGRA